MTSKYTVHFFQKAEFSGTESDKEGTRIQTQMLKVQYIHNAEKVKIMNISKRGKNIFIFLFQLISIFFIHF